MLKQLPAGRSILLALGVLVCVGSTGCSTLNLSVAGLFEEDGAKLAAAPPPGDSSPTVAVEFYPQNGKPERGYVPLDSVTYVQDVFDKTNANRRFGRMTIQIHRQLPNGGGHKFDVRYDRKTRKVESAFDYALRPGDRLQITEDTTNTFDDMLEAVTAPLGGSLPF